MYIVSFCEKNEMITFNVFISKTDPQIAKTEQNHKDKKNNCSNGTIQVSTQKVGLA